MPKRDELVRMIWTGRTETKSRSKVGWSVVVVALVVLAAFAVILRPQYPIVTEEGRLAAPASFPEAIGGSITPGMGSLTEQEVSTEAESTGRLGGVFDLCSSLLRQCLPSFSAMQEGCSGVLTR